MTHKIEVLLPPRCTAADAQRLIDACSADLRAATDAITVPARKLTQAEIDAHRERILDQDDRRARMHRYGG